MSLIAATTCGEGVFQYCNYGYDKTKYNSYQECMAGELKKCGENVSNEEYNYNGDRLKNNLEESKRFEENQQLKNKQRKIITVVAITGTVLGTIAVANYYKLFATFKNS